MTLETQPRHDGEIAALGPWFHNLHLPDGRQTAPEHRLGDFPGFKWQQLVPYLPESLAGRRVLDVGCNAGFYSFELAKRGAQVLGIDREPRYLRQAEWARRELELEDLVELRRMDVYELARLEETFDLVLFMGVLYHLRHPLLALDLVAERTAELLALQTLTAPGGETLTTPYDLDLDERERLLEPEWPTMAFIEHRLAGDPTNWWAPTPACVEAMCRSAGLEVIERPGHELYLCRVAGNGAGGEELAALRRAF